MDLGICAALAVSEYAVASATYTIDSDRLQPRATMFALLIFHYLAVKYYRVFLYHRYFSPLRHLPGPDVRLDAPRLQFILQQLSTN